MSQEEESYEDAVSRLEAELKELGGNIKKLTDIIEDQRSLIRETKCHNCGMRPWAGAGEDD